MSFTRKLDRDIIPEKLIELVMCINCIHSLDIVSSLKTSIEINQVFLH